MSRTPEQQKAWEKQCYGCYESEIDQMADNALSGGRMMLAMSILSDVQHIMSPEYNEAHGDVPEETAEQARQWINKAKYLMHQFHKEERAIREFLPQLENTLTQMKDLPMFKKQAD